MRADKLLKQGKKTLQSVNDRFGWQGDEDVQAFDILTHVLGHQPDDDDEIKKYEPKHTLTDNSKDGLELTRRVIAEGREWVRPGGWVLIEIVPQEWKRVRPLFKEAGYSDIRSTHGELKLTRVICGRVT